jgi:hypothetical protein
MNQYKEINHCRLCGSNGTEIFNFGLIPLANAFKNEEELNNKEFTAPLVYFKCENCHSVQLKYEVDSNILFKDYLYESPPNLTPHFKELAKTSYSYLKLEKNDLVLDIGSNNGLLLQEYKNLGLSISGVEPATNIAEKARKNGVPTYNSFFNKGFAQFLHAEFVTPKLITSTNCFAHLSDLNDFVEGLSILMGNNSYFIFENAYLLNTLQNLDFGQAYFEHFYMHSIAPLKKLFEKYGLELFKIEYNNVQMGSIRGYVRKNTNKLIQKDSSIENGIKNEEDFGLITLSVYKDFIAKIDLQKQKLIKGLKNLKEQNKKISVYGWPAKMTLLNKYFDLESYIDFIIEESLVKIGKFAPGTKLEIKNLDYFGQNPTHCCIVGAYNFFNDIVKKNGWYEGEWINPLFDLKK